MDACFQSYLSCCRPFHLPAPWDQVPIDPWAFHGPADPSAVLALLTERHAEQLLIDCGIAQRISDGPVQLHAWLAVPDVPLVAVRDPSHGRLINLLTPSGCVRGDVRPLFEILSDKVTFDALASGCRQLLLTAAFEDAILLRSLGFAAPPICGLDHLNQQGLGLLASIFGIRREPSEREEQEADAAQAQAEAQAAGTGSRKTVPRPDSPSVNPTAPAANAPTDVQAWVAEMVGHSYLIPASNGMASNGDDYVPLTIVGWSPRLLSLVKPDAVTSALRYLEKLHKFRGLELDEVNVWSPHTVHLEALRFALAERNATWVKDVLLDSLHDSNQSMALAGQQVLVPVAAHDFASRH